MKNLFIIAIIFCAVSLSTSCTKDNDLRESTYISDPEDNKLPSYSEWGYNTFGAYYDRDIFRSNDNDVPIKVIVNDSSTSLLFSGYSSLNSYYYENNEMSMNIILKGLNLNHYTDFVGFNDSIIDLKSEDIDITLNMNSESFPVQILSGELHVMRVQKLFVDDEEVEVILSGTFSFKALVNNEPVTMSDGRFDVGVGDENFYKY